MEFTWLNTLLLLSVSRMVTNKEIITLQNEIQNIELTSSNVYIGAKNSIIKYTNDLVETTSTSTGPHIDNPYFCIPDLEKKEKLSCDITDKDLSKQDNYNQILLITEELEKSNVLLTCGTLYQGMCTYRSLDNLTKSNAGLEESLYSNWISANLHNASTVAVPSQDGKTLYVARTLVYKRFFPQLMLMMSARALVTDEGKLQALDVTGGTKDAKIKAVEDVFCSVPNQTSLKISCFHVHYTSAHSRGVQDTSAVYFTTVQKPSKDSELSYVSKLVRVTPEKGIKNKMKVYVENVLVCRHNGLDYNVLLSASYLKISKTYPGLQDHLREGDEILFGVFALAEDKQNYPGTYTKFAICQFSLNSIDEVYDTTISRCKPGKVVSKVDWIVSNRCDKFGNSALPKSYDLNTTISGIVLHTEENSNFQAITAFSLGNRVALFVSAKGSSVRKFALINDQETIRLHEYSRKAFQVENPTQDDSVFQKMKLNPPQTSIFAVSRNRVARLDVVDCASRKSCFDCVVGPSCGWCTIGRKCTLRLDCPNNDKPLYFVDDNVKSCPSAEIEDAVISMNENKEITLITKNIPQGLSYKCQIDKEILEVTRADTTFTCDPFLFSKISSFNETSGERKVNVSVVTEISGTYSAVVTSSIVVYKCSSYKSCDKCVAGKHTCGWCTSAMMCSDKKSGDCGGWIEYIGEGSNKSSNVCPMLLNTTNKYIPNGYGTKVMLNGRRFPKVSNGKKYQCILKLSIPDGETMVTEAERKSSSEILCRESKYSYPDTVRKDYVKGLFTVKYGDALMDTAPGGIESTIYKCGSKSYCNLCLRAPPEWKCGWCGKPRRCKYNVLCQSSSSSPVKVCPNPIIKTFSPLKAPVDTSTKLTIHGVDLGLSGDLKSVSVAGLPCHNIIGEHVQSVKIVCKLEGFPTEKRGFIEVSLWLNKQIKTLKSQQEFAFVQPTVGAVQPMTGPCSGGTMMKISGNHLDAGNEIKVTVSGVTSEIQGNRTSNSLSCVTEEKTNCKADERRRRRAVGANQVCVRFDGSSKEYCSATAFSYQLDPLITAVYTNKERIHPATFFAGGQVIHVEGQRLNLIQDPKIIFHGQGKNRKSFMSSCQLESGGVKMRCVAPNITTGHTITNHSTTVLIGFKMANVANLKKFRNITIEPNPVFYPFEGGTKTHNFQTLSKYPISGKGLEVLEQRDIQVKVKGKLCDIDGIISDNLLISLPSVDELHGSEGDAFPVEVVVGEGGLVYNVGSILFQKKHANNTLYFILAAAAAGLVIIIIVVLILYKRRHLREKKNYHKNLQLHMDKIESQYARECKEAFAEYQIESSDLTNEVDEEFAPCREFSQFAMRVLYPGLDSHPILEKNRDDRKDWEKCMVSFIELLKNKDFILTFVRTLEGQSTFQMTDRCIVASLLMVSLQDDIVFVTDILKELLTDLINKAGSSKRPKLLLRRTESIAEKLLTNWLAYTLYDFLNDVIGDPLFKLYTAINILLDKEPADALTYDAKNSLSEDKLLRTKIDFRMVSLNVEYVHPKFGAVYEGIPVLSTDTITQCKEKMIRFIYKNQPHSLRPYPDMLHLGHVGSSGSIRYLQDCDSINLIDGEWKKLNTLEHALTMHKIPECAQFRLSLSTEVTSVNGGSTMLDDSLPNITFPSSVSSTPMLYDYATMEPKLFHLVKPSDSEFSKDDIRQSKMMAEVYLTRLLKTKETLLNFVNHLFNSIFGLRGIGSERIVPPSIKFLFDFLDGQAEKMCIDDFDVHHTWKNNSLPLRFWINIIKNPDFVFDIRKSSTVDSCLSVIAQLFMDSCSPDEHRLGKDSPSNKLLFAKEIPGYKKEVKRFYKEVKESRFDELHFYRKLEDISHQYGRSFNSCNAAFELMSYAIQYKVRLMDNLEDNTFTEHAEKLQQIMENIPDD